MMKISTKLSFDVVLEPKGPSQKKETVKTISKVKTVIKEIIKERILKR